MIWFTSDLHLGHRAAISMCERPFETVEEMNEILIRNFNSCVKKNDTVYILGDIGTWYQCVIDALSDDVMAEITLWIVAFTWAYS